MPLIFAQIARLGPRFRILLANIYIPWDNFALAVRLRGSNRAAHRRRAE